MTIADFVEPDLTGWLIGHDILRTQFGKLAAAADEVEPAIASASSRSTTTSPSWCAD